MTKVLIIKNGCCGVSGRANPCESSPCDGPEFTVVQPHEISCCGQKWVYIAGSYIQKKYCVTRIHKGRYGVSGRLTPRTDAKCESDLIEYASWGDIAVEGDWACVNGWFIQAKYVDALPPSNLVPFNPYQSANRGKQMNHSSSGFRPTEEAEQAYWIHINNVDVQALRPSATKSFLYIDRNFQKCLKASPKLSTIAPVIQGRKGGNNAVVFLCDRRSDGLYIYLLRNKQGKLMMPGGRVDKEDIISHNVEESYKITAQREFGEEVYGNRVWKRSPHLWDLVHTYHPFDWGQPAHTRIFIALVDRTKRHWVPVS